MSGKIETSTSVEQMEKMTEIYTSGVGKRDRVPGLTYNLRGPFMTFYTVDPRGILVNIVLEILILGRNYKNFRWVDSKLCEGRRSLVLVYHFQESYNVNKTEFK